MSQRQIKMTDGFRKANIKAGQLTEADANGEWLRPEGADRAPEVKEEFLAMLRRLSTTTSPGEAE